MAENEREQKLRELYAAERAREAHRAPDFERLARADAPRPRLVVRWGRVSGALAALVVVALTLGLLAPRPERVTGTGVVTAPKAVTVDLQQWATFSNWRASTDVFLSGSNDSWAGAMTTTTDRWMSAGPDATGTASTN